MQLIRSPPIPPSIYFGGCAYGSIFYVGVYKAMIEKWGNDFPHKTNIYGDSAGLIMVLGITQQIPPDVIGDYYIKTGRESPGGMLFSGSHPLEEHLLKKLLGDFKDPQLYEKLNRKMYIGRSTFFSKHFWTNQWNSNEELYTCVMDAFNIPYFCNSKNRGNKGILDGAFAFSGNDLPHGDNTLYVADETCAEISMAMTCRQLLYPQLDENYHLMVKKGYDAFMNWDGTYKKKVGVRKTKIIMQCIVWVLKIMEMCIGFVKNMFLFK